jgi:hypothetical protein
MRKIINLLSHRVLELCPMVMTVAAMSHPQFNMEHFRNVFCQMVQIRIYIFLISLSGHMLNTFYGDSHLGFPKDIRNI